MASIYKRNGIWYVAIFVAGKRVYRSAGTKRKSEVHRFLTSFKCPAQKPTELLSLQDFIGRFLEYSALNHAKNTTRLFRQVLYSLVKLGANLRMGDITPESIDRYKTVRLRQVKPVSVNVELRMLKSAFATAVRWKLLLDNPCKGVRFAHVPDQAPIFMSPCDFKKVMRTISEPWLRELVIFAVVTGLRRAEIVNLRWVDIDLGRGVINIQSNTRFTTKHGRRRTIPLNETAIGVLKRMQQNGEYVFTLDGGRICCDWVTHLFKRYVRKAGLIDDRIHFHSLRHTFASWLVQGGATLYEVQKLLGHSSASVTEQYSHLQPEQMHSTVNKIVISMN